MLERELKNYSMSSAPNPETILQLGHSISCLRSSEYKDFRKDITPFITNVTFNQQIQQHNLQLQQQQQQQQFQQQQKHHHHHHRK